MKSPRFLPVVVSPEAATAMAMPAATAQAAVQVNKVSIVAADELNEIDRAADAPSEAPLVPVQVATTVEPPVRATPADETIRGEAAPSPVAEPVTTVVPATPPAPTATSQSSTTFDLGAWFSKLGSWFSNALGR